MNINLINPEKKLKLSLIILATAIVYSLLIFNGSIDVFAPKHIIQIDIIIKDTYLSTNSRIVDQIPGFYALGAVIKLITGLKIFDFLVYPIQLLPYIILFYAFIYKFSKSNFFAAIITSMQIASGTTGTARLFFWPHGIGFIIFLSIILTITLAISKRNYNPEYRLLLVIEGISLVFISYNSYATFMMLLFIFIITLILNINIFKIKSEIPNYIKSFINLFFIMLIVQLGLSKFIFDTFIPLLQADMESGVDRFFINYFQAAPFSDDPSIIPNLLINYPKIISIISVTKYTILIISILIFIYMIIKRYCLFNKIFFYDQLAFSFILSYFIIGLFRLGIGGNPISWIYFPGILSLTMIFVDSNWKWKTWALISVALILILTPIYTISMNTFAPKEIIYDVNYIEKSSNWLFQNMDNNINCYSDELTKNLLNFYKINYSNLNEVKIIKEPQIATLIQKSQSSVKSYYILNYKLAAMSIQNWRMIKSWRYVKDYIDNNHKINKIFDNTKLSIYINL